MSFTKNGQLSIFYELLGNVNHSPIIMLAGAGRPSTDYDVTFYGPLIEAGYCPIRVDLRDTGQSTGFAGAALDLHGIKAAALDTSVTHGEAQPCYTIAELAQDVLGVMDDLSLESAHFVGRSIGGLVAQQLAVTQPKRVKSLALIMAMSRSLAEVVSDPTLGRLMAEHVSDEESYVARQLLVAKANGMAQDFDAHRIEAEARIAWRHGFHAGGTARHFAACLAAPDLRSDLKALTLPALIIHGRHDQTIPLRYAEECAASLWGATFIVDDSMGHDGPPRLRRIWADAVLNLIRQAAN